MAQKAQAKKTARSKAKANDPLYGTVGGATNPSMWKEFMSIPTMPGSSKVVQNPDPTLRLSQTRGRGQAAYEDMLDKDPHLAGLFDTRFHAVVSLPREILPPDGGDAADDPMVETVKRVLEGIDEFEDSLESLLMSRLNGFQVVEVEWELWTDGTVGVKKLHPVPPDAILFDVNGLPRLKTRKAPFEGEELPPRKFIVMTHKATATNPYGRGLGRSLWWYAWFKREGVKFWSVFIDKFGQPTAVGKHPAQWNDNQKAELVEWLQKLSSETAIRIPSDVEIELLEAARTGGTHEQFLKWLDDQMSRRVVGQEMSSTAKNTGLNSQQGQLQGDVRQDVKERDARAVKRVLQDTLVRWIVDYNYGPQDPQDYPMLLIHAEPPEDLNQLVDFLEKAMGIGIRVPSKWARTRLAIPEPEGKEEVLNDIQAQQARDAMPIGLGGPGNPEPDDDEAP